MKKRKMLKCRSADRDNKITSDLCPKTFRDVLARLSSITCIYIPLSGTLMFEYSCKQSSRLSRSTALKHRLHHRRRPASGLNDVCLITER